ncbi:acyl-CoA dehydrogenase family member 11-like, partial [Centruroides sculpturatus]|uniref:acyl-CoA dehydrogenase family member 11-like n=1 Tax=Centruroides sculpturatus TaxID=218467 RepID=UPI000C6D8200
VLPIWEGTTNILSLDVLRSLRKYGTEIFGAYYSNVLSRLHSDSGKLQEPKSIVELALHNTTNFIQENPDKLITAARDLAYSLARIYIGSLLIENASNTQSEQDNIIAFRWCCTQDLAPVHTNHQLKLYEDNVLNNDRNMIMLESFF